jgi:hypothetical protein
VDHIDKAVIINMLIARGLPDRAAWVDRQLPDQVDPYANAALLRMLKIDPEELAAAAVAARSE